MYMKLVNVKIHNFRGYKDASMRVDNEVTTLIGKNDVGKSTIVDALEIFFNNSLVKIDSQDLNIKSSGEDSYISISCEFSELPQNIIIDSTQQTNLQDEFLVNENGNLEIKKVYDCSKKTLKPEIYAVCKYPDTPQLSEILSLTHPALLKELKKLPQSIQDTVKNLSANAPIRKAIRSAYKIESYSTKDINLQKIDGKELWKKIETLLPIYALFQSDRPSNDSDAEVQDPMNSAIKESISKAAEQLEKIQNQVQKEVAEVAEKTILKLREMDPEIAKGLTPRYKNDPKWEKIFGFEIEDEQGISLNKRGSGVRRLVLLNFFRAKVDMLGSTSPKNGLIYAIEEPETAQHADNQRKIMTALLELGQHENCQILITTHLAETAKMAPESGIRLVTKENGSALISNDEGALSQAAKEVGLFPKLTNIKATFFVEGTSDILFFESVSRILNEYDSKKYIDFSKTPELLIVPMGGGSLEHWVNRKYLQSLETTTFYLFDKDTDEAHLREVYKLRHDSQCEYAAITDKREIENYISPSTICRYFSDKKHSKELKVDKFVMPKLNDDSDVPSLLQKAGVTKRRLKDRLNSNVASQMTCEEFFKTDSNNFISGLIAKISSTILQSE